MPYPYDTLQKRRPTPADREQLWEDGNFVGGAMILVITLLSFLFSIVATVLVANGILAADVSGSMRADHVMTRGEAAQMLLNLMTYQENAAVQTGFFSWTTM